MRLVNREHRDSSVLDHVDESLVVESLRCNVEDLESSISNSLFDGQTLLQRERGIELSGSDSLLPQDVDSDEEVKASRERERERRSARSR